MKNIEAWVKLNMVEAFSPLQILKLLKDFGSPEKIIGASPKRLSSSLGMREERCSAAMKKIDSIDVKRELENAERLGVKIITLDDPSYPKSLAEIHDPPILLYVKGDIGDEMRIGIVGSRKATMYGRLTSRGLAGDLANLGLVIVSGMARGIDTSAHIGALEAGGRTVAVLGSGIDVVYPSENRALAKRISDCGALVSEFPLGRRPFRRNFPRRNRIIVGLSLGLVVVEAEKRSGALISANLAAEYGREVFAVPGRIDTRQSEGTNALIQDGAKLVRSAEEILEEFPQYLPQVKKPPIIRTMEEDEAKVYEVLGKEPIQIDTLAARLHAPISEVSTILMDLELKGLIKQIRGKQFIRA